MSFNILLCPTIVGHNTNDILDTVQTKHWEHCISFQVKVWNSFLHIGKFTLHQKYF